MSARTEVRRKVMAAGGLLTADARMLPDYLIVGGKRCGTTSLQAYLSRHPSILPPHAGKGTHYFDVNYVRGARWFQAHFPTRLSAALKAHAGGAPVITGEASPYYCFHPAAFARIAAALPGVRIIFVLRDPVERAYSHYRYECRRGFEDLPVHAALDAERDRLDGEPERLLADASYVSHAHIHHSYQARGMYAEQLARASRHFPAGNVLVLHFAELFGDPERALPQVLDFLRLPAADLGPYTRHEAGDGSSMPQDVRARLEGVFHEPNRLLRRDFGHELA